MAKPTTEEVRQVLEREFGELSDREFADLDDELMTIG